MQDAKYEANELERAHATLDEVRKASLADRREAREGMLGAMRDAEIVAERIAWLLNGSYGYGPMLMAKQIVANTRMNREAAIVALIGAFEWRCPDNFVRDAWKQLSKAEQRALQRAVTRTIDRECDPVDHCTHLQTCGRCGDEYYAADCPRCHP